MHGPSPGSGGARLSRPDDGAGSFITGFKEQSSRISHTGHTRLPAGKAFAAAEENPPRGSNVPKKEKGKEYYLYEPPHYGHYPGRR